MSEIQLPIPESASRETQDTRAEAQLASRDRLNYFNYFTEIEDTFIRRRGKHLLLSPIDWALIESWKAMGVPLHVALRGIEQAFDSHDSKPQRRSVKSLMYCQEEVEAQFGEWLEGQRGGRPDGARQDDQPAAESEDASRLPFPRDVIARHLADSRQALKDARAKLVAVHGDELDEALARAVARLDELDKDFAQAAYPDGQALEDSLTQLEALLDRALRSAFPAETLKSKRALVAEQLEPYRARMERATYDQTLDNLLAKTLREACGVPRLSLFYL